MVHNRILQVGSAQKSVDRADMNAIPSCMHCYICQVPKTARVSACLHAMNMLVLYKYADLQVYQEHTAPGILSRLDLYYPQQRLGVMVDGAHHFKIYSRKVGKQQAETDAECNQQVMDKQGEGEVKGLLRLHFSDTKQYDRMFMLALRAARDAGVKCFVIFSPSYKRKPMIKKTGECSFL
jgi:hypothetical protein